MNGLVLVSAGAPRLAPVEYASDLPGAYRALLPRKAMTELQKVAGDANEESRG